MIVSKLIEQLKDLPPNATVLVPSFWDDKCVAPVSSILISADKDFVELGVSDIEDHTEMRSFGDKLQELMQLEQDLGMYTPEALAIPNPLVRAP